MSNHDVRRALAHAFREITLAMTGLFELHDADPEMVEGAADALGKVFRSHLQGKGPVDERRGRAAMEALLDEVETAVEDAA
jgi:hypothetical protein